MTTRMLRRGLPRVVGGEPWPPAVEAAGVESGVAVGGGGESTVPVAGPVAAVPDAGPVAEAPDAGPVAAVPGAAVVDAAPVVAVAVTADAASVLRRGLPRVVGGEPWPPADAVGATSPHPPQESMAPTQETGAEADAVVSTAPVRPVAPPAAAAPVAAASEDSASEDSASEGLRRGLPRTLGGEPWPPAGTIRATSAHLPQQTMTQTPQDAAEPSAGLDTVDAAAPAPVAILGPDLATPLPWTRTVWNGRSPRSVAPAAASARRRPTWPQAIAFLFGAAALGVLAGAAIAFVRALLSFPFMQDFLAAFPGEYEPAIAVEPGFAPWVGWQHFFNAFLMVLIIRSGLRVRTEKRPTAFWTPRNNTKGKISLTLWFHQALDILWLVNGVVFVVLLIVTGHWVRIVPTSWEVFPNALSAALQYLSFNWPHENGWNNYNSLQQLAYFTTVFIAAPLAAITGFRMSGLWPKKAERLSKAYPVEWARALHFPIMLYFVAFIIAHVALVMLTGFLRNLNHMYASQDAVTWTGFWVFIVSLIVIAGGWFAARPLVIAPIAKVFGNVSAR